MAQIDSPLIHQALFGYADGHRLLEASLRLSSRDLYDLSAISDLATGAQLHPDESYLTGTALQNSRQFALVRTWPAPDMPRPGCVWSHVLILTPELLTSRRDLSGLNALFVHPRRRDNKGSYTCPIDLGETNARREAPPKVAAYVLRSYYAGQLFPSNLFTGAEVDAAVLAIWSQQWPKLRAAFSFRTARTNATSGREDTRFDFQPFSNLDLMAEQLPDHNSGGSDVDWVDAAAEDAISEDVTPLRRFLWRYGKDVQSSRQRFQNLVKIHLATKALAPNSLPLSWAESIASLFPGPENAATLKRDMLGIEPAPLSLSPAVTHGDMLELLAVLRRDSLVVSDQSVEERLSQAPANVVPALASSLIQHEEELAGHAGAVMRIMICIADDRTVTDTRVPPAVRFSILKSRHELIDSASLAATGDEDLLRLFDEVDENPATGKIITALLQRDVAAYPDKLIREHAGELLFRAIAVRCQGTLSHGGATIFRSKARELISSGALKAIGGAAMAAQAADLLRYPIDGEMTNDVLPWLSALERPGPEADGHLRTNFEAYMCVVAMKSSTPSAWNLLHRTLPSLRAAVLKGSVSNPAYELLDVQLPPDGWNSWDIHRRLLIGLRDLYRRTGVDRAVVAQLALTEDDFEYIFDDRKNKKREKKGSIFWPWY